MSCMKKLRFSSRPRAKVRHQGPPGSARAQPCFNDGEIVGHPSNTSEIEKRILSLNFVENYRKRNKKLRTSKQMKQEMEAFEER